MSWLKDSVTLKLNWFEVGILQGALRQKGFERLPRRLQIKMSILFHKAYLNHKLFGESARTEINKLRKEFRAITKAGKE